MSNIIAKCIDQAISFLNTPVISSGNINYDTITFEFCSKWDGFIKTAIFYRTKDDVYYRVLDDNNSCLIPKEVLVDKGLFYVGVFGNQDDITLTSEIISYRVHEGAVTEGLKPSDPTPDIYSQIMSIFNAFSIELASQDAKLEEVLSIFTGAVGNADTLNGHKDTYYTDADNLVYDNEASGLTSGTVQGAIDELVKMTIVKSTVEVTTTSSEFFGKTVICTDGSESLVNVFDENGKCSFKVRNVGTYTITCEGVSISVQVYEGETSSVNLVIPKAFLNLTTENLNGGIVTVTVGGKTYTGTFVDNKCDFTIYEFGTATITCGTVTTTQVIEEGNTYTVDVTRPYATLVLTTSNLNGRAATVTVDNTTYNGLFSDGECVIIVYKFGTATIKSETVTLTQEVERGGVYMVDVTQPTAVLNLTTSNLNGFDVTVTVGGSSYTGTFVNGTCSIEVYEFGSATIASTGVTLTQEIESGESYDIEINRPTATLNLTTSNMNGGSVSVSINGANYTGTFANSKCTITVYEFGTATITCGSVTKTQTVESGKSYTVDLSRPYATLNLTTENLEGYTVTVNVGGSTYSGKFANSKCTVIVYTFGTATITCSETTVTQEVASGGTYTVDITEVLGFYYVQNGVMMNSARISGGTSYGKYSEKDGYLLLYSSNSSSQASKNINFEIDETFKGKTIIVEGENLNSIQLKYYITATQAGNTKYVNLSGDTTEKSITYPSDFNLNEGDEFSFTFNIPVETQIKIFNIYVV